MTATHPATTPGGARGTRLADARHERLIGPERETLHRLLDRALARPVLDLIDADTPYLERYADALVRPVLSGNRPT